MFFKIFCNLLRFVGMFWIFCNFKDIMCVFEKLSLFNRVFVNCFLVKGLVNYYVVFGLYVDYYFFLKLFSIC